MTSFRYRNSLIVLLAIYIFSLCLGLWALHHYRFVGTDGGMDGVAMAWAGRNLFSGNGFTSRGQPETIHSPLYPVLVGLAWKLSGDLEFAGQIVSVIACSLIVAPIFFLGRDMFGGRVALLGALMAAVFPGFIFGATEIRPLALYTLLLTSSAALLYHSALHPSWLFGLAGGLAIGLSYLTRPEALVLLPLGLILPALKKIGNCKAWKPVLVSGAGLMIGFIVVSCPYWNFLHRHLGKWMLSGRTPYTFTPQMSNDWERVNFYIYEHQKEFLKDWEEGGGTTGFLWQRRGIIFANLFRNVLSLVDLGSHPQARKLPVNRHVINVAVAATILLLILIAVRRLTAVRWRFRDTFLLLFLGTSFLYQIFTVVEIRYCYFFLPLLLILLADGCETWRQRCSRSRTPLAAILGWAPAFVILIVMTAGSLYLIPRKIEGVPYEYKILGLWMRDNLPGVGKSLVMSRKMGVPFYSDSGHALIHPGTRREALEFAQSRGADYLVIDEWTIPQTRPALSQLLDESMDHWGLEKLHSVEWRGRRTVLYRLPLRH